VLRILAIALGLDTGFLTNLSVEVHDPGTGLLDRLHPRATPGDDRRLDDRRLDDVRAKRPARAGICRSIGPASLSGAAEWLNSQPLTAEGLKERFAVDLLTLFRASTAFVRSLCAAWAEKIPRSRPWW